MLDDCAAIEAQLAAAPAELQAKMDKLEEATAKAATEADKILADEPGKDGKEAEKQPEKRAEDLQRLAELNNAAQEAAQDAQSKKEEVKELGKKLDAVADAHDQLEKEVHPE